MNIAHLFLRRSALCTALLPFFTTPALSAATSETTRSTFTVTPGSRLVIEIGYGRLELSTTSDPTMEIEVVREISAASTSDEREFLEADALSIVQRADVVTIRSEAVAAHGRVLGLFRGRRIERDYVYRLQVPAALVATLETRDGDISIHGLQGRIRARAINGNLRLENVSGRIHASALDGDVDLSRCGGSIALRSTGGSIRAHNNHGECELETIGGDIDIEIHHGAIKARATGGAITAAGIAGSINAEASGGAVRVALAGPPSAECRLSTSGGSVAVSLPPGAGVDVDASASGGSVRTDLPVASNIEGQRHELRGTVNGGGPLLHLRSDGGNIQILEQSPPVKQSPP